MNSADRSFLCSLPPFNIRRTVRAVSSICLFLPLLSLPHQVQKKNSFFPSSSSAPPPRTPRAATPILPEWLPLSSRRPVWYREREGGTVGRFSPHLILLLLRHRQKRPPVLRCRCSPTRQSLLPRTSRDIQRGIRVITGITHPSPWYGFLPTKGELHCIGLIWLVTPNQTHGYHRV